MKRTLIFTGDPKSTQHIYHHVCRGRFSQVYMTLQGKVIKEAYQWEAKQQWAALPLTRDITLTIRLYFSTKRKHDIDNFNKLVLDAMNKIVYLDDSQITKLVLEKHYDKHNGRVEIEIEA